MIETYKTIFKIDSTGRVRVWRMEREGSRYRTVAGLEGGNLVTSGWTQANAASQATDEVQAVYEIQNAYTHQLNREYRGTVEDARQAGAVFHQPMLAKSYDSFPGPHYIQPKFDGIRCIARAEGMFSRQGQEIVAVPHIHAMLAPLFERDPDLIIDGELYNHDFRDDFGAISSIVRKKNPTAEQLEKAEALMQYHVYDGAGSIGHHPFPIRFGIIAGLLPECEWIIPTETRYAAIQDEADRHYGEFLELGYEGAMARDPNLPYQVGKRSKGLLKRKQFLTREFPIVMLLEGNGNWSGAIKTVVLRNDPEFSEVENYYGKGRFGAGIRGSKEALAKLMTAIVTDKSTATVRYFCLSPDGVPRFPVVIDIQLDGRND